MYKLFLFFVGVIFNQLADDSDTSSSDDLQVNWSTESIRWNGLNKFMTSWPVSGESAMTIHWL